MNTDEIKKAICQEFCGGLSISTVPAGMAISTDLMLDSGDPITFYLSESEEGFACEDDGDFIASALATGMFSDHGSRAENLDALLRDHGAYLDRDTCQIRREPILGETAGRSALHFISALIRVRDILLLSREKVAASFLDDLRDAVEKGLGQLYEITEEDDADNPADILLRNPRTGLKAALVYAANSNEKLMAALLRHSEQSEDEAPVIAMLDDLSSVSRKRFMMAQNRSLLMPFFSTDKKQAVSFIQQHAKPLAA